MSNHFWGREPKTQGINLNSDSEFLKSINLPSHPKPSDIELTPWRCVYCGVEKTERTVSQKCAFFDAFEEMGNVLKTSQKE